MSTFCTLLTSHLKCLLNFVFQRDKECNISVSFKFACYCLLIRLAFCHVMFTSYESLFVHVLYVAFDRLAFRTTRSYQWTKLLTLQRYDHFCHMCYKYISSHFFLALFSSIPLKHADILHFVYLTLLIIFFVIYCSYF